MNLEDYVKSTLNVETSVRSFSHYLNYADRSIEIQLAHKEAKICYQLTPIFDA